jgi:hypothetical protein
LSTTKVIKLAKVGWLAAYDLKRRYDPKGGIYRGRDEIDRIAGVIKATHPDFEYQPLFPPEELGDAGRV